ncbi:MAG: radical SAM protein [Phycisphaerales bacterium]|jgi:radical SAM protein with 4Fe4S-binding SPASM domain
MKICKEGEELNYRFENFGGIIANSNPPFLAFVNRDYMRELGLGESELWNISDESIGLLSAPTEVHFSITEKCSVRCQHCYVDAGERTPGELDVESLRRALDILAEMKVFHIAFAGGDAMERPELLELAQYARSKGIVPNFTVSGFNMNPEVAQKMRVFGQVNVSVDGVGEKYGALRPQRMFKVADKAVDLLVEAGVPTGINCLVSRGTFDGIEELFKYAKAKKANHMSFLRFKPTGRAKRFYEKEKMTHQQKIGFMPMLKELSAKYKLNIKADCSFMPMICYHNPPLESFETVTSYGCEAGNVLMGMKSNGQVTACSFLNDAPDISIFDLQSALQNGNCFEKIRNWPQNAVEPCKSCKYLNICKGGCHGVAEYVTGSFYNPDPECPFVAEYANKRSLVI